VVFETAQQLLKQGQEVGLLILFDPTSLQQRMAAGLTSRGQPTFFQKFIAFRSKLARHWSTLALLGFPEKRIYVRDAMRWRSEHHKRKIKRWLCNFYLDMGLAVPLRLRRFYFLDVGIEAVRTYTPQPYIGRIILYKGEQRSDNPQVDWGKLPAKGLTIQEMPGTHLDSIQNPHIQKSVAERVKVHLHEAQVAKPGQEP
jgi:thioesterase domain-containing protein